MLNKLLFKSILLVTLLSTEYNAQAQSYIPTVKEGRTWEINWNHGMHSSGYDYYQITCDTTINSNLYKKVYYQNDLKLPTYYIGSVREDLINQRVYFYHRDSTNETLVADYNLTVGSVFHFGGGFYEDIDSIRTVNIFGLNRKVLYFNISIQWIEGVGYNFYGIITDKNYKQVDNINDNAYNCTLSTIENHYTNQVEIFPNPVNDYIRFKGLPIGIESVPYEIYSISGKKLLEGTVRSENEISLVNINENIIILKLTINDSPVFKKIILNK